jgi:hypothetical protein
MEGAIELIPELAPRTGRSSASISDWLNARQRDQVLQHICQPVHFEQLASERRVIHYKRGLPSRRFERIRGSAGCVGLRPRGSAGGAD